MQNVTKILLVIFGFIIFAAIIIASIALFTEGTGVLGRYTICNLVCTIRNEAPGWTLLIPNPFAGPCGCA